MADVISDIAAILYSLPEHQREVALRRISAAQGAGWRKISLWIIKDGQQDQDDLCGISPNKKIGFDFLPRFSELKKNLNTL